ncbi:MAG TPA: MaoC/PaaZ C-terminal domain-containing protein [Stellaceae bacterium]|nr:MaoC/PaaZ C-terminal domain-containing protein [Stellaceae bacterium]
MDYETLKNWRFEEVVQRYTARDSILYALGLGLGHDPMDRHQLRFVYEKELLALPTMAVVLGYPGMFVRDPRLKIDWRRVLHGEQGVILYRPLPVEGVAIGRTRITGVIDKGAERGALLFTEREVIDGATGEHLATLQSTSVLRGDGGFGGPTGAAPEPHPIPERFPDLVEDSPTLPQSALIYRLSGDMNPLHADPEIATAAAFPRPILHGLCTFGVVGTALLKRCCGFDPARLKNIRARFSSPVFPGETLRTEMWHDGAVISFRARVVGRETVVLNNGRAEIAV